MTNQSEPIRILHVGEGLDPEPFADRSAPIEHITAETVDDALRICTNGSIDCVLVAYDLPNTDGPTFISEIRTREPLVPVISIDDSWDDNRAQRIIDHGGSDYIIANGQSRGWRELLEERVRATVTHYHRQRALEIDDRQLHTERTRFEKLFEGSRDCIVFTEYINGEPIIRRINPAFESVFGYTAETAVGRNLDDLIVPEEHNAEAKQLNEETIEKSWVEREVRRETADGEHREFLFRGMQVTTQTGAIEGYPIYTDITDRKQRERELQRQNEQLDEFAGIVSHDLRNPLNIAKGHLDLARKGDTQVNDHLETVARAHDRMESMVEDLLSLARDSDVTPAMATVDLAALTDTCWQAVKTDTATINIETTQTIWADEQRLQQLLENLLRNAIEHASSHVTITVGPLSDGFYVEDDGPGIPSTQRERIFESGFSTAHNGVGFGLRIVRQITDAHGWTVEVSEGTNGGARFEITGVESGGK